MEKFDKSNISNSLFMHKYDIAELKLALHQIQLYKIIKKQKCLDNLPIDILKILDQISEFNKEYNKIGLKEIVLEDFDKVKTVLEKIDTKDYDTCSDEELEQTGKILNKWAQKYFSRSKEEGYNLNIQ